MSKADLVPRTRFSARGAAVAHTGGLLALFPTLVPGADD